MRIRKFIFQFGIMMLFVCIVLMPSISWGDVFVRVDGIEGESTDDKHQNWIEAIGFSGGVFAGSSTTSGATSERPRFDDITIFKYLDKASTWLHKLALYV